MFLARGKHWPRNRAVIAGSFERAGSSRSLPWPAPALRPAPPPAVRHVLHGPQPAKRLPSGAVGRKSSSPSRRPAKKPAPAQPARHRKKSKRTGHGTAAPAAAPGAGDNITSSEPSPRRRSMYSQTPPPSGCAPCAPGPYPSGEAARRARYVQRANPPRRYPVETVRSGSITTSANIAVGSFAPQVALSAGRVLISTFAGRRLAAFR